MRYAIKGERPGTHVHAAGRFIATDPIDGGAAFKEDEIADLERRGYELLEVSDVAIDLFAEPVDEENDDELEDGDEDELEDGIEVDAAGNPSKATDRIAEQTAGATQHNDDIQRRIRAPRRRRKRQKKS